MDAEAPNPKLTLSLDELIAAEKRKQPTHRSRPVRRERSPRANARPYDSQGSRNFAKAFNIRRSDNAEQRGTTVKVTNVSDELTWRDIKSAFSEVGHVERCDVGDGVALVTFERPRDAQQAVRMYHGGEMNGRIIKVSLVYLPRQLSICTSLGPCFP